MKHFCIEVTRQDGYSSMGHYFPAETRTLQSDGEPLVFDTSEEAEAVAQWYRALRAGITPKSYRVVYKDVPI